MTFNLIDKSTWPVGPWNAEPDLSWWYDEGSKLPCAIFRSVVTGALFGAVGVPEGHAYHMRPIPIDITCHWGLQASGMTVFWDGTDSLSDMAEEMNNMHKNFNNCWWFTFACNQVGDFCPAEAKFWQEVDLEKIQKEYEGSTFIHKAFYMREVHSKYIGNYKDINFVKAECQKIACQLEIGAKLHHDA